MVERTEVAREARRVAQQVVAHAEADSRRLRHEAEDYIDQKLAAFEVVLERTMQTVLQGPRAAPGGGRTAAATEPPDEHDRPRAACTTSDESPAIFDQDGTVSPGIAHPRGPVSQKRGPAAILARPAPASDRRTGPSPGVLSTHARTAGRSSMSALRIDVADLLTHPGARRPVHLEAPVDGLGTSAARASIEPVRARSRARAGARRHRGPRHACTPAGTASAATACAELAADARRRRRRAVRAATRSTARPTRSRATRSTSSSSCATPCCSSSRSRRRARRRRRRAPATAPGVPIRRPTTPTTDPRLRPIRGGPRSPSSNSESTTDPAATRSNRWPSRSARPRGAKTRQRRASNWRLAAPARSTCPNCGAVKQPHIVCGNCGWYGGRQVIDVE